MNIFKFFKAQFFKKFCFVANDDDVFALCEVAEKSDGAQETVFCLATRLADVAGDPGVHGGRVSEWLWI